MQDSAYINQRLREAFNFSDDDLAVNRQGRLTDQQLFHLIKRTAGPMILVSIFMTIFFAARWRLVGILFLIAYSIPSPILLVVRNSN